jgi:hypothetical protein
MDDLGKMLEDYDGAKPGPNASGMVNRELRQALSTGPRNTYAQIESNWWNGNDTRDPNSVAGMGTFGTLADLQAGGFNTKRPEYLEPDFGGPDPNPGNVVVDDVTYFGGGWSRWPGIIYTDQVSSVTISAGDDASVAGIHLPAQPFDWEPGVVAPEPWKPLHTKDPNQDG